MRGWRAGAPVVLSSVFVLMGGYLLRHYFLIAGVYAYPGKAAAVTAKETIGGRQELAGACRTIGLLLAEPDAESAQVVAELATVNPWLEQAAREVAGLPLDRWAGGAHPSFRLWFSARGLPAL